MSDKLSQLPDELLVSILSQLTLREAVVLSCLSSRWRYIWTRVTRLNFNLPIPIEEWDCKDTEFCRKEASRHIDWVNHVLALHKSKSNCHLEEFSVSCLFQDSFQCEVDKWLNLALATKVESLKIELFYRHYWRENHACFNLKDLFGFQNLKVLTLCGVDVDSQVVKMFLSSCALLEHLSIQQSNQLQHLDIIGPSLKLKHLEIQYCQMLSSLKINQSVNLVSFNFEGTETNFELDIVTSVLDVHIDTCFFPSLSGLVTTLATKFTQLVMLSLKVYSVQLEDYYSLPKLNNLKQLMLSVTSAIDCSLIGIPPLLDASPNLQKFEIEVCTNLSLFFSFKCSSSVLFK
ncbi:F-box protein At5g03100-like [Lycium ferocissimum]|uniref:F-box protein At5g03100-like n=1 Tax=Lycium ferocissimum TaxID=112874 RepID=UPI002814E362|nr:F-box protein At5g03100-like [Lycium ferocissimum]